MIGLTILYRISAIVIVTLNLFNVIYNTQASNFYQSLYVYAFAVLIFALSDILFTLYTNKENLK